MATPVLIAGLPGKMAAEVADLVAAADDLDLFGSGPTSLVHEGETLSFGGQPLTLVGEDTLATLALPAETIAVDYTTPDAALTNARWYAQQGVPFVMGTTGFDRAEAVRLVESSETSAVIAPNMATPIVLLQAAGEYLAREFPAALAGAELSIYESHQATKRDTSGTAKAMVGYLNGLGIDFGVDQINRYRDPKQQREELQIPEEYLNGHACHQYRVTTAGESVTLGLEHNVMGRRVYAEGTLAAVRFLRDRVAAGSRGEVFSMEDVLRG